MDVIPPPHLLSGEFDVAREPMLAPVPPIAIP
jgi:hypothetical protein